MAFSFYNTYQNSASDQPPKQYPDDEQAPFGFQSLPANPPTTNNQGMTSSGATSPANQVQKTGNTGMNQTPQGSSNPNSPQTTTGTPSSATGSGLPAYGSNWSFDWMTGNNSNALTGPGSDTTYQAPSLAQMGVNFSALPNYNPLGVEAPNWNAPGGNSTLAHQALSSILSGDGSGMDVSGIKNRLKEQRLQMEKDELGVSRQAAASRGMINSGFQGADERRIRGDARRDILGGFRDVDIAAAERGVANKLAASEALNSLLSGDVGRANVGFQNELAKSNFLDSQQRFDVTDAREGEKAALEAALAAEGLRKDAASTNLASWEAGNKSKLAERGMDVEVAKQKTNELIARLGLSVNLEEIARSTSRDKMQFLTDIFKILVDQEQFNASLGLEYNQLGQSMNEMMANIAKSIGV